MPEYLLAMKLIAMRLDLAAGKTDLDDILKLMEVVNVADKNQLLQFAAAFYPEARVSGRLRSGLDVAWGARATRSRSDRPCAPLAWPKWHSAGMRVRTSALSWLSFLTPSMARLSAATPSRCLATNRCVGPRCPLKGRGFTYRPARPLPSRPRNRGQRKTSGGRRPSRRSVGYARPSYVPQTRHPSPR